MENCAYLRKNPGYAPVDVFVTTWALAILAFPLNSVFRRRYE